MDLLKQWLNGPRLYADGVDLFVSHSRDKKLNALFRNEAETEYKRKRLVLEIEKLISKASTDPVQQYPQQPKQILQSGWPARPIADPVIAALYEQWKPLYDEMLNLQARIYDVAVIGMDNDLKHLEAGTMAHRICDLDDLCDEIYSKRDYYYANGKLPAVEATRKLITDPTKWASELENLKRYERRYVDLLQKHPQHRLAAKRATQLVKVREDILLYKKLLKIE
jgi:hypothetical protein